MNRCILIPIIVGLFSAILGYIIGRLTRGIPKPASDSSNNKKSSKKHIQPTDIIDKSIISSSKSNNQKKEDANFLDVAPILTKITPDTTFAVFIFNATKAKEIFGKTILQDDLKVIEGIGLKVSKLLHNYDIKTWKDLSNTSVEKCKEILLNGGYRFKYLDPGTWPKQAGLAYEGKWEELLKLQNKLHGGK